jgi:hypothetical protein
MSNRPKAWIERRIAWPLLCALVFSIPWEKSILVPGVGTITRLGGLLVLAAAVAAAVERRSVRPPNAALVLAGVFVAWASLTYFWSVAPSATAQRAQTFLQLAVMLGLIWDLCRTPEQQAWLMRAYVGGAAVVSALTLARYARGLQTYYRRYAATGFEPNDLGLTVVLALPLAMYLALTERGWPRWAYRAAVALAIAALLLSASRTALARVGRRAENRQRGAAGPARAGRIVPGAARFAPEAGDTARGGDQGHSPRPHEHLEGRRASLSA